MSELFFIPGDPAPKLSLLALRERLGSAGLPASEEDEMGSPILVLDGTETVLRPTLENGIITSIVVDWDMSGDPAMLETLGNTLASTGFISPEDGE